MTHLRNSERGIVSLIYFYYEFTQSPEQLRSVLDSTGPNLKTKLKSSKLLYIFYLSYSKNLDRKYLA